MRDARADSPDPRPASRRPRIRERSVGRHITGERSIRHDGAVDRAIAGLAERQHGVVGRRQLLDLGVKASRIDGRLRRGQLHSVHRGVYAVGHAALSHEGRLLAAVIACGPGAVLSHRSAARLWRILPGSRGPVEVNKERGWRAPRGVWVHRDLLRDDEVTAIDGIRVTSVPRTLLDLAVVVTRRRLEQAINEAEVLGLTDLISVSDLLKRYPSRRGARVIRDLLERGVKVQGITRGELEDRFLALLDAHGLPRPRLNASVRVCDRFLEVDCLWFDQRLVVDLDGRAAHGTDPAFERDRERDRLLLAAGLQVARLTWRQVHDEPTQVASDLRQALKGAAAHAPHRSAA